MNDCVLLSVEETYQADARATAGGVPGVELMEAAGRAVANGIRQRWDKQPVAVLCGPGSNGGDGFVVARLLREAGWPVRLALLGSPEKLTGDAAVNAKRWQGTVAELKADVLDGRRLAVDALFGAGLTRPLEGAAKTVIDAVNARKMDCVAIDIPSGVDGDTGEVLGTAPRATLTITFFRAKPGHFLLPGRILCGDVNIADIGIPESVLEGIAPKTFVNDPSWWRRRYPRPKAEGNKYSRGHLVVMGGAEMTGAARLAAGAARRAGAGLVTIAAPSEAFAIYAAGDPGTLVKPIADDAGFEDFLSDPRRNAVLAGPGAGTGEQTRRRVLAALQAEKTCLLDADALTVFQDAPRHLFDAIHSPCLLTPHEGEFRRLFAGGGGKLARARAAARQSGAVILLKGADTVIAAADERAVIDATAPPDLATAGTGDVLAGIAAGLMAQGMNVFDAACAAVWLHGKAAAAVGPGLIAEDLPKALPRIIAELLNP
ncbi:MAG: NAD(P)H-hydrate dehydratase [Rhodospirillales bacterium]|jgi:NAD(P)H-hydrate epimerase|nr:NAD(P)H-hydrate dehydratase [Rhodospirillales bacterium]HIJ42872.1 NAD(P)H-hydrate dehydratase [Rhodospirillaceae bacterium]HIJ93019.1 NAD(P)H-hydrate dehydratase [Rhodospirillaceae bacterium]HJP53890.1 NAD(P)H-hydrate dehydratase [Rhodospirillales bacterium]